MRPRRCFFEEKFRSELRECRGWPNPKRFHVRYGEQFINCLPAQRRCHPPTPVNKVHFHILPEAHDCDPREPATHANARAFSADWRARRGHPVVLVGTFVDPVFFRDTTGKVNGWIGLSPASGRARSAGKFYALHERRKQRWVKELVKGARARRRFTASWAAGRKIRSKRCGCAGRGNSRAPLIIRSWRSSGKPCAIRSTKN